MAAYNGDKAAVEKLIRAEGILSEDIDMVIHIALKHGYVEIFSLFLNEIKDQSAYVLLTAARYGHLPLVQFTCKTFGAAQIAASYSALPLVQFLYKSFRDVELVVRAWSGETMVGRRGSLIDESVLLCASTLASIDGHESVVRFLSASLPDQLSRGILSAYEGDVAGLDGFLVSNNERAIRCCLLVAILRRQIVVVERIVASRLSKKLIDLGLRVATLTDCHPAVELFLNAELRDEIDKVESLCSAAVPVNAKLREFRLGAKVVMGDVIENSVVSLELGSTDLARLLENVLTDKEQFLIDCLQNAIIFRRLRAVEALLEQVNEKCTVFEDHLVDGYLTFLALGNDRVAQRLSSMSKQTSEEFFEYCACSALRSDNLCLLEKILERSEAGIDHYKHFTSEKKQFELLREAIRQNYPLSARFILFGADRLLCLSHSKLYGAIPFAEDYRNLLLQLCLLPD